MADKKKKEREDIPLRMFKGNIDVLLEHNIEVEHISLKRDEDSGAGVILMLGFGEGQEEKAKALGFTVGRREP